MERIKGEVPTRKMKIQCQNVTQQENKIANPPLVEMAKGSCSRF